MSMRSTFATGLLSQQDGPEGEGDSEPDGRESAGGGEAAGAVTHEDEADSAGVDEEGERADDHGTGFEADVSEALPVRGQANGGEGDGGSGSEDAAKALGFEDVAEDREGDDYETADEESSQQVRHGQAFFLAFAMRVRAVFSPLTARSL